MIRPQEKMRRKPYAEARHCKSGNVRKSNLQGRGDSRPFRRDMNIRENENGAVEMHPRLYALLNSFDDFNDHAFSGTMSGTLGIIVPLRLAPGPKRGHCTFLLPCSAAL